MATLETDLNDLEKKIRQLKIEFDIYFNGGTKLPPKNLQFATDTLIQRLLEETGFSFPQKFRFQPLVSRYSAYRELWRKKYQQREEKGQLRDERELQQMIDHNRTAAEEPQPERLDQLAFVTADPRVEPDRVKAFYEFIREARERVGEAPFAMDMPKFQQFLTIKTAEIKQKYRCEQVECLVQGEQVEKKVKLTAKFKKGGPAGEIK